MSTQTTQTTPPTQPTQYGFFFDQSRCTSCTSCMVVCKSWNMIPPGPVRWLRLFEYEKGAFPDVRVHVQWVPCYHCQNPVCVDAAQGAMFKEPKYGAVLIDPTKANGPNMRAAWSACPYGAIVFDSDAPDATASKCTMCIDRLEAGQKPVCILSCRSRALDFDTLDNLKAKYGNNQQLEDLPDPSITKPAVVFKPIDQRKQLVKYDAAKALALLGNRDPLPRIYSDPSAVTTLDPGLVSRGSLNLKPSNTKQLIELTRTDGA